MAQKPVNLFTILIVCILYVKFSNGSTTSNSTEVQPINTTSCKNCAVSNATVVPFGEPVSGNDTTSPEISASKAIFTLHSSVPENLDHGKSSTDLMPLPTDSTGTTLNVDSSTFKSIRITGNDNYSINSLESESKIFADVSALIDSTTNVTTSEVRTEEAFVHTLRDVSPIIPTFGSLNEISGVDLYGVISAASTTEDVWRMLAAVDSSEEKSGVDFSAVTSAASTTEDVWAMPAAVDSSEKKSGVDLSAVTSAASTTEDVWAMPAVVDSSEEKSGVDLSAVTSAASTTEDVWAMPAAVDSSEEKSGVDLSAVTSAASTTEDVWAMPAAVDSSEEKSGVDLSAVTSAASTTENVWAMPAAVDTSEEKSGVDLSVVTSATSTTENLRGMHAKVEDLNEESEIVDSTANESQKSSSSAPTTTTIDAEKSLTTIQNLMESDSTAVEKKVSSIACRCNCSNKVQSTATKKLVQGILSQISAPETLPSTTAAQPSFSVQSSSAAQPSSIRPHSSFPVQLPTPAQLSFLVKSSSVAQPSIRTQSSFSVQPPILTQSSFSMQPSSMMAQPSILPAQSSPTTSTTISPTFSSKKSEPSSSSSKKDKPKNIVRTWQGDFEVERFGKVIFWKPISTSTTTTESPLEVVRSDGRVKIFKYRKSWTERKTAHL